MIFKDYHLHDILCRVPYEEYDNLVKYQNDIIAFTLLLIEICASRFDIQRVSTIYIIYLDRCGECCTKDIQAKGCLYVDLVIY